MKIFDTDRICVFNIHYENYPLEYFLDCQQALGIKNVELLGGHPGLWMDYTGYQDPAPIRRMLEERGLTCAVFSPDNCFYGYQFAVKEPLLIERSFQFYCNALKFASELGTMIMEVHPGWGYWNEPEEEGFARSVHMHRRLSEVAAQYGITLACEALRPEESLIGYRLDQMKHLFDEVNHPNFKMMIDMTAMSVAGETIQEWFDTFGAENIIHSHFQDCDPYGHYIWGDGKRNLQQDLIDMKRNGYTGLFSQEITDRRYYDDPFYHDKRNMQNLRLYFKD